MEPAPTVLVPSVVLEGDPLFPEIWRHLLCRFPCAYTTTPSTIGPLGPDYSYFSPFGWAPKRRDIDVGKEGGYWNNYI